MRLVKSIGLGLVAGVALTALAAPMAANANVIGYSTLQVTNVVISSGGDQVSPSSVRFSTATSSRASFDGAPGISYSDPTDAAMSCVGACGTIAQNDFSQVSAGNGSLHFARGDLVLTGTILQPGGANAYTVAETQLTHQAGSNAGGEVSSTGFFTTVDFTPPASDVNLTFDAMGELLTSSTNPDGFAQADFSWSVLLMDLTDGSLAGYFLPSELNQQIAVNGIDSATYSVDDSFQLTVSGLQANHQYRITFAHNSNVEAALPVPATLAVLGIGLLGLGGLARRRKRRA